MNDAGAVVDELAERIRAAAAARTPLEIRGGGTKAFYGNPPAGEPFPTTGLAGAVAYEPSELVVTVRAGTPLAELEALLASRDQMLAFEPPHFGAGATVGGCVAAGLAGPRRASAGFAYGGVRDFVLGAKLLDGRGRTLSFGGTVMKNVAGYDVSRALAGSLGVLGVILEVSLKVLPRPPVETTLVFEFDEATALARACAWGARPLPISATAWHDGCLRLRLSGAPAAVGAARRVLGGEAISTPADASYWRQLREQQLPFFAGATALWRVAVPPTAPPLEFGDATLIEWGGAQRWVRTAAPAERVRERVARLGGHATLFRARDRSSGAFTPLAPALLAIHRRLKAEFDPAGVLNPGRLYAEF